MPAPIETRSLTVFSVLLIATIALVVGYSSTAVSAPSPGPAPYSHFFASHCAPCHTDDSITCNGCHEHGKRYLTAYPDKSSYAPGEEVTITFTGGEEYGWLRGMLEDRDGTEIDRNTGPTLSGDDGGPDVEFPMEFKGRAPGKAGTYTWTAVYYGNTGTGHATASKTVTINVNATSDIVVDVVPSASPLIFPSLGGTIDCTVELENTTSSWVNSVGAIYVRGPGGLLYGPIVGWKNIGLPGGAVINSPVSITLPGNVPTGVYSFNVYIGDPTTLTLIDADSFDFIKEP